MSTKLFCALDFDNSEAAWHLYKKIRPLNPYFKIGLELFALAGPDFVRRLTDDGAQIFLDLKFHDIPNTVAGAARQTAGLGVHWLNVHLSGGQAMVEAARAALDASKSGATRPQLLGVTVLTSLDSKALQNIGFAASAAEQVLRLAKLGHDWGVDGVVCSAQELQSLRQELPKKFITVVPGVRPDGANKDDQSRTATPKQAAAFGADFIVVGRPISQAKDPVAVVEKILEDL